VTNVKANILKLDKLENPGITSQGEKWSFFTDSVMGGLSEGRANISNIQDIQCYQMTGNVTTEKNGGFIQIRTLLNPLINAKKYEGIYIKVYGNNKNYSLHVRTKITLAPWQYYSYRFVAKNEWLEIKAPFKNFKKSNFYQPKELSKQNIKSVGLVAAFEDFYANVCLAEIGFY
jgi:hypothetical protein